ncbi:MAG: VOC family protein [Planctomycetota bacterium]
MPAPSLQPGHFNHIALPTADAERGARFYCEVLGFRLVPRPEFSFDGRWLYRAEAGVMVHLIHDANHHATSEPMNTRGHHFAMQSQDITGDLAMLAAHGIETVERVLPDYRQSATGYRQVFFQDPDGHVIELGEWPAVADMVVSDIEQ